MGFCFSIDGFLGFKSLVILCTCGILSVWNLVGVESYRCGITRITSSINYTTHLPWISHGCSISVTAQDNLYFTPNHDNTTSTDV